MAELDQTDRQLLALLRTDAREPVASLARKLELARSTVQERIARLERTGVVAGYTIRYVGGKAAKLFLTSPTSLFGYSDNSGTSTFILLSLGMNMPRVRFSRRRYFLAAS